MAVISFTEQSVIPASTPVKPDPEMPPLIVKMVTVWPICLDKLLIKQLSCMDTPSLTPATDNPEGSFVIGFLKQHAPELYIDLCHAATFRLSSVLYERVSIFVTGDTI